MALVSFGSVSTLSRRYLSVIFPWVRSGNPLVESVAEQALPTRERLLLVVPSSALAGHLRSHNRIQEEEVPRPSSRL